MFIFNLQEVSDMLATLVLIADVWSLRKSHCWLTIILLILFLYFHADRAKCACLKNPGTVYARTTIWSRFTKQALRIHSLDQWVQHSEIREKFQIFESFLGEVSNVFRFSIFLIKNIYLLT